MNYLRKKRSELMTIRELSHQTDLCLNTLYNAERGKGNLTTESNNKISKSLKIDMDILEIFAGRLPDYAKEIYLKEPDLINDLLKDVINIKKQLIEWNEEK